MKTLLVVLFAGALSAAPLRIHYTAFAAGPDGKPDGWTTWSARAETAPRTFVDRLHFRDKPGSLAISGNSNVAAHGGWQRLVPGIEPQAWYRFTAFYQAEGVPHESWQILALLDWQTAKAKRAGQPDYVAKSRREGAWTRVTLDTQAPADAAGVLLRLYLSNAPNGTVWWTDITLEQIPVPPARKVSIASINLRPKLGRSAADNVDLFVGTADRLIHDRTDVILFPEGITVVGTGKKYADVAETIPGDSTRRLGELAKRQRSYVVAGLFELEGSVVYNTAVLIDRAGSVVGKYRKVYVPREEIEGGITPGNEFPVFQTDFGTVGLMICYDVFFADPARALASRGAELILMPIWGGDERLAKARAIENQVFLVASGYDHPTYVMDRNGELLSTTRQDGTAATATVDLSKRYVDPWLGDMRIRTMKELRVDIKPPLPGFEK